MDVAWIALIGTLAGGAGLKIVESILARGGKKRDDATAMREELRKDQAALKEELRTAEKELDLWKEKYFLLFQEYIEVKSHVGHPPKEKEPPDW